MAMLSDTVVCGGLRVTDKTYTDTIQAKYYHVPTSSGGSTYGAGSNGQVLRSNGTTSYWGGVSASDVGALASNQGTTHANKFLIVNSSGIVTPTAV